jgi:C4-dicarboxylate-specific signal transduction histidine kinase
MNRLVVLASVAAALTGVLGGFLWWGQPTRRLETELRDTRASADRLGQRVDELRTQGQQLEAQLKAENARAEGAERSLRIEKEISSRLHMLVSEGKK